MPRVKYEDLNIRPAGLAKIAQANVIIADYQEQGYTLTLRQVYYQFVSRGWIPNNVSEYNKLGDLISKGRRAGLVDWSAIVDRTRNLKSPSTWDAPSDIVAAVAEQFRYDLWADQSAYVEVWFEKDALMGVFERAADPLRLPYFSCRGYTSDSEIWSAAQRLARVARKRDVVVLHFGDHDPSGMDMTRDIRDRLRLFGARRIDVRRLALNMDQVEEYTPPPNPAKETDSRFANYRDEYGDESWELDALEPTVLAALVQKEVATLVDVTKWRVNEEREAEAKGELQGISDRYDEVIEAFPPTEVTVTRAFGDDEEE